MITRGFPNIITEDLATTKAWYLELLDWQVEFDSDWFVHLSASDVVGVELGMIDAGHEIVSDLVASGSAGIMVTLVVDDVDDVHRKAVDLGYAVVQAPQDLFYGQRRMVLRDPSGTMVDISSECEPSKAFLDSLQT